MILPFGVSWLCTLLLWGCICFPPKKGYILAHGFSAHDDFSSHAGGLGPQTSNQFHAGEFLSADHDSVLTRQEPVQHEDDEDSSFVTSLSEDMVQSNPHTLSAVPSEYKSEREGSGSQHPFGLLLKDSQGENDEGVSFSTIHDFNRFIENMKRSFLTPGSDLRRHFQSAQEIIESRMASGAKDGTAHNDAGANEAWSEPITENEQGASYQMPSESLSVPKPVDSSSSLSSTGFYDDQDSRPRSALYPHPHFAAEEHASSNYGGFDNGDVSAFTAAAVQNELSTNYKLPEPRDSFFSHDFSGHVTASLVGPPNGEDFTSYSSETSNITPLTSETYIQQPDYTSHSTDSREKPSGGFEREDFQSEQPGVTPDSVMPSYGKGIHVSTPRRQIFFPNYLPKPRERPAPSFQTYQPTVGKESKPINYSPAVQLPVSIGSVSSSSDGPSPQSNRGHVETSSPHQDQVFTPSSSLHGSSRHDGYVADQRALTNLETDERSHLSEQNFHPPIQEPKQPISGGVDSIPSMVNYARFNSLANLAPSASETAFSRFGNKMFRNFGVKNRILSGFPTSDLHAARNALGSFFKRRRGPSLNAGYVGASRAGLLGTFIQQNKLLKHPVDVRKKPGIMAYMPPDPLSAVSGSTSSGVFWRNRGNANRLPPQRGAGMFTSSVNSYAVKSRNHYVRNKVSLSKTHYAPYRLDQDKTQHAYKTVSHSAKGF